MDETPPIRKITLVVCMRRRGAPLYHCPWSYSDDGINEVEKKKSCHEHKRHLLAYQEEDV